MCVRKLTQYVCREWCLHAALAAVATAAVAVVVHLVARIVEGSMIVPALLPWTQGFVAFSLIASLIPLIASRERAAYGGVFVSVMTVFLGVAGVCAFSLGGMVPLAKLVNAVRIALTSRELFGLAPAVLISSMIVGDMAKQQLRAGGNALCISAIAVLPGPLFSLLSLAFPGNERILASFLFPLALAGSAVVVFFTAERESARRLRTAGPLVAASVLFYIPAIRGTLQSGEASVLCFLTLAVAAVARRRGLSVLADAVDGIWKIGPIVLALGAGVALNNVVGLQWLVDRRAAAEWVPVAGAALFTGSLAVCARSKPTVMAAVAFGIPLVITPGLDYIASRWPVIQTRVPVPLFISGVNASGMDIPRGQWVELASRGLRPRRRMHSSAVFDSNRRKLLMLGSDTHGWDWDTSVYEFDISTREWTHIGLPAPAYTYRVDALGRRVAGSSGTEPQAMHAYNQLVYDPKENSVWLVSAPLHNHVPTAGRPRDVPWSFDLARSAWHPRPGDGPTPVIFSGVVVYDTLRDTLVASAALETPVSVVGISGEFGLRRGGVWELGPERSSWRSTSGASPHGANVTGVFDDGQSAMLVFERRKEFMVHTYKTVSLAGADSWSTRSIADGPCAHRREYPAVPAVFVGRSRTLLLPEGSDGGRRTCLYDAVGQTLADLGVKPPPNISMNFDLVFDSLRSVALLVTGEPYTGAPARVWGLRLDD